VTPVAGDALTVLYDEDCGFCERVAAWLERRFGLVGAGIGSPTGERMLRDLPRERRYDAVHVVDARGRRRSGADVLPPVLRSLPRFAWAAIVVETVPWPFAWGYGLVARHRHALSRLAGIEACAPRRGTEAAER
jgi:predicted DCC family thiol-disulfide oxidoreductase YuxK